MVRLRTWQEARLEQIPAEAAADAADAAAGLAALLLVTPVSDICVNFCLLYCCLLYSMV